MTKPDWCPQRVWDEAVEHWRADGCSTGSAIGYARAILAAEKRERDRTQPIVEWAVRVTRKPYSVAMALQQEQAIRNRNGE